MRKPTMLLALLGFGSGVAGADSTIPNPQIDMAAYLKIAREAAEHRESHRVTEAEFIKMSGEPNTIVLDARSREKYDLLHIRGAVNLSFPDIAIESLAKLLPDKNVRILIYCNNNFIHEPEAFPSKAPAASLNVSTYISLYSYGYKNVYELGPLLDVKHTRLTLEPTRR
jgi:hypothetical protein